MLRGESGRGRDGDLAKAPEERLRCHGSNGRPRDVCDDVGRLDVSARHEGLVGLVADSPEERSEDENERRPATCPALPVA